MNANERDGSCAARSIRRRIERRDNVKRKADGRPQWADEEALSFLTFADSAILSSQRTLSGLS